VKKDLVCGLRPKLLLEEQLQDVGERLQQSRRSHQRRSEALLETSRDLALRPDHPGGRQQECMEDDDNEAELDDEDRIDSGHLDGRQFIRVVCRAEL
jgi:hypothetical protein